MNAFKNLIHGIALSLWAIAGVALTFKALVAPAGLGLSTMAVLGYWLWLAGLAGATTWCVSQFRAIAAALLVHSGAFFLMSALPMALPFSYLRYGLDLLRVS